MKTVVCIICDSAYYKSDFERLTGIKYIGENLVICPEHDITSNVSDDESLSEFAKIIIAQLKTKTTEQLQTELLEEIANKTQDLHNNTTIDPEAQHLHELLMTENTLLKTLNKELNEKNDLLRELYSKQKDTVTTRPMYSEIAVNLKQKPTKLRVPKLKIKSNNTDVDSDSVIKSKVTQLLTNEKSIHTKDVYIKNKEVVINCADTKSLKAAEVLLKNKMREDCEVKTEQLNKPRIKIVNIDNATNMDAEAIECDINKRNFNDLEDKGKVVHMFTKDKGFTSVIMEVSSTVYQHIREKNNRLLVGYQSCRVYDLINVKPCFNCGGFGHSSSKCNNSTICLYCSLKHKTSECNQEGRKTSLKCPNCTYSNHKYKTSYNACHSAFDRTRCEIYGKKIKRYISSTDYPIQPTLPTTNTAGDTRLQKSYNRQRTTLNIEDTTKSTSATKPTDE